MWTRWPPSRACRTECSSERCASQATSPRIAQLEESIWHSNHSWVDDLAEERAADPEGLRLFVAEADELTVCAGWVRFPSGTEFVTLWGGATLPAWRGRGIYRALVAHRAKLAAERGRRYIEVDASEDSRRSSNGSGSSR